MTSEESKKKGALVKFSDLDYINIDKIEVNRKNPREKISRSDVANLVYSVRSVGGILVPLVVYYDPETKKFILLDGERRWRAAKELAKKDKRFQKVPAAIIKGPPSPTENLESMMNIHFQRKQWSTAATAMALGSLIKRVGKMSNAELSRRTGLKPSAIKEAKLFLRMPKDIQKRCYDNELDEYYAILLARNLETCEGIFNEVFQEYGWEHIVKAFIGKVDENWIRNAREFNKISSVARTCIRMDQKELFREVFKRMLSDPGFTPAKAEKLVNRELSIRYDELLLDDCETFIMRLKQYSTRLEEQKGRPAAAISLVDSLREIKRLAESILSALSKGK